MSFTLSSKTHCIECLPTAQTDGCLKRAPHASCLGSQLSSLGVLKDHPSIDIRSRCPLPSSTSQASLSPSAKSCHALRLFRPCRFSRLRRLAPPRRCRFVAPCYRSWDSPRFRWGAGALLDLAGETSRGLPKVSVHSSAIVGSASALLFHPEQCSFRPRYGRHTSQGWFRMLSIPSTQITFARLPPLGRLPTGPLGSVRPRLGEVGARVVLVGHMKSLGQRHWSRPRPRFATLSLESTFSPLRSPRAARPPLLTL
jgi:hypothetical protein